jgi:hypothetical protein
MANEARQAGDNSSIEIDEDRFEDGVKALNQFAPRDWEYGSVRSDEIVRAICDAMRLRVRTNLPPATSGEWNRRSLPVDAYLENLRKRP